MLLSLLSVPVGPTFGAGLWAAPAAAATTRGGAPLPIVRADLHGGDIVFAASGDLWSVAPDGGDARALTSGPEWDDFPLLAPDGASLVFRRERGEATDLFRLDRKSGSVTQLTWHPKIELARAWSRDGTRILFSSNREGDGLWGLWEIPAAGGWETRIEVPRGAMADWSPDGRRLVISETSMDPGWVGYRGGAVSHLRVVDLATGRAEALPHEGAADGQPQWHGDTIYFVSERSGPGNVFAYDVRTRRTRQLTQFPDYGVEWLAGDATTLLLVRQGSLWRCDPASGALTPVPVTLPPLAAGALAPALVAAGDDVQEYNLTADGRRVLVSARGEILSLDAAGRTTPLTVSPERADRSPAAAPDGVTLAWFSEVDGAYRLMVGPLDGSAPPRTIPVGERPSIYAEPRWSPDSRYLVTWDLELSLWLVERATGRAERLDRSTFPGEEEWEPAFSPDGRWIAWARHTSPLHRTVFLRAVAPSASAAPVRLDLPGLTAASPVFSADGRRLFVTAASVAPLAEAFGMSAFAWRPLVTRSILALDLGPDGGLLPATTPGLVARWWPLGGGAVTGVTPYRALRTEPRNIVTLARSATGGLLAGVETPRGVPLQGRRQRTLYRIDAATGREQALLEGVSGWVVSPDGQRILADTRQGYAWYAADSVSRPEPAPFDSLVVRVDPRAEWTQIYHEAFRFWRLYFHDPGNHGADLDRLEWDHLAHLPGLRTRRDLNALLYKVLGTVSVSHFDVGGGATASTGRAPLVGLLGADFERVGGRVRLTRVFEGDNLSRLTTAPLAQPGVAARAGEWLLAVDGRPVDPGKNLFSHFELTSPRAIELTLGPDSSGVGARKVKVEPLPGENTLRRAAWAEANRRRVEELSGGALGYVHIPNTGGDGLEQFLRGYLSSWGSGGLILDDRFNSGGAPADLMVDLLARRSLSAYAFRDGDPFAFPTVVGPPTQVMITNEMAGSGGDTLPFLFRAAGLGPLVGTRTMGAGIGGYRRIPAFVDGGQISIPNRAFYDPKTGRYEIENAGVTPDVIVPITIAEWRAGRDPQLERAVELALSRLRPGTKLVRPVGAP